MVIMIRNMSAMVLAGLTAISAYFMLVVSPLMPFILYLIGMTLILTAVGVTALLLKVPGSTRTQEFGKDFVCFSMCALAVCMTVLMFLPPH